MEEDTLLWYWRIGRLCVEVHSTDEWGLALKWWPGMGVSRLLSLGPLCFYWWRG